MIRIKRAYDLPSRDDGCRILVDRLWPRGLTKNDAKIDEWLKDVAPSHELRRWFGHRPERWDEFKSRYFQELAAKNDEALREIRSKEAAIDVVTLLYSAKDSLHNNVVALKEYLENRK